MDILGEHSSEEMNWKREGGMHSAIDDARLAMKLCQWMKGDRNPPKDLWERVNFCQSKTKEEKVRIGKLMSDPDFLWNKVKMISVLWYPFDQS